MEIKQAYKFCPKCGGELRLQDDFSKCNSCGFKVFFNVSITVGAVITNNQGEVLMTRRAFDPGKGEWDLPGGFMIPDESVEECLDREIQEELGAKVEVQRIIGAYHDTYLYQGIDIPIVCLIFTAKLSSDKLSPQDDVASIEFMPKSRLAKLKLWMPSIHQAVQDYLKGI